MTYTLGWRADPEDSRDLLYGNAVKSVSAPPVIDYEPIMPKTRDQGSRSACVGFAIAHCKEVVERKQWGNEIRLSPEFVYDQIKQPGGGSYLRDAMRILTNRGICEERILPYRNIGDHEETPWIDTRHGYKPVGRAIGNARKFRDSYYIRVSTFDEMAEALITAPFPIGVLWDVNWFNPSRRGSHNGYPVLKRSGRNSGGHAFAQIGIDMERGLAKWQLVSWKGWGAKGKNECCYIPLEEIGQYDAWIGMDVTNPLLRRP